MKKIIELINKVENTIPKQQAINSSVSASAVGWHIEHIFLTINVIVDELKKNKPGKYKSTFSFARIIVFTMNKIPRGRAKSPKIVTPKKFDIETLKMHSEKTKMKIQELTVIDADNYFTHPFFGNLKLKPTIKFLGIHTKHHLDIISDILAN